MKKDIKWEVEWQIKWRAVNKPYNTNIKKTSKKYIEDMLYGVINPPYRVLKRNPGHISLCEVKRIPGPDVQKIASRLCRERIAFVLRDEWRAGIDQNEENWREWDKAERKKLNRKAKRRRKKILKAVYRGFDPELQKRAET